MTKRAGVDQSKPGIECHTLYYACFTGGDGSSETYGFDWAIIHYTEEISLDGSNHVPFNYRSAAYARVGDFAAALEDAKRCQQLKPDWPLVSTIN